MSALPVIGSWRKFYLWTKPGEVVSPWRTWEGHVTRPYRIVRYVGRETLIRPARS